MIGLNAHPRRIAAADQPQISNLVFYDANVHRHLDWRSPLEWIGASNYWALEEYGKLIAVLACPEDPPQVGWIRLFACEPRREPRALWARLWENARAEIDPQTCVAAIATKGWFRNLLRASGFEMLNNVVMLEMLLDYFPEFSEPQDFRIRSMRDEDLPQIADIDREAFGWFWHNSSDTLQRARAHAARATVAENETGIIGYQISAGAPARVHLSRLAVKPQAQGRGVGLALVRELVARSGVMRFSVNTQQDNAASLALYKKIGFIRTGDIFPVLTYQTHAR